MAPAPLADFALRPLQAGAMSVLFFVALESEAAPIIDALGLAPTGDGHEGYVAGTHVTLQTPGVDPAAKADRIGPVHAAAALTRILAHARTPYDIVVNAGTAGGFESRGQKVADLVVARDTMFHDARVAIDGFDRVARAHTWLSADEATLARLATALDARAGLVSTGSSLDATAEDLACFAQSGAIAKEMELAALAVVCRIHDRPLVALKGITDLVDHHEPTAAAFLRNLEKTCARVAAACGPFLETIGAPGTR